MRLAGVSIQPIMDEGADVEGGGSVTTKAGRRKVYLYGGIATLILAVLVTTAIVFGRRNGPVAAVARTAGEVCVTNESAKALPSNSSGVKVFLDEDESSEDELEEEDEVDKEADRKPGKPKKALKVKLEPSTRIEETGPVTEAQFEDLLVKLRKEIYEHASPGLVQLEDEIKRKKRRLPSASPYRRWPEGAEVKLFQLRKELDAAEAKVHNMKFVELERLTKEFNGAKARLGTGGHSARRAFERVRELIDHRDSDDNFGGIKAVNDRIHQIQQEVTNLYGAEFLDKFSEGTPGDAVTDEQLIEEYRKKSELLERHISGLVAVEYEIYYYNRLEVVQRTPEMERELAGLSYGQIIFNLENTKHSLSQVQAEIAKLRRVMRDRVGSSTIGKFRDILATNEDEVYKRLLRNERYAQAHKRFSDSQDIVTQLIKRRDTLRNQVKDLKEIQTYLGEGEGGKVYTWAEATAMAKRLALWKMNPMAAFSTNLTHVQGYLQDLQGELRQVLPKLAKAMSLLAEHRNAHDQLLAQNFNS